ncbi:hypothetical protein EX895_002089 [Sporisorium graminicola]|uniref:Uncharacterized protein n=1 Tax=Sporisorium graminicola TaxID=280036 RepID=A0A4U7KZF5_9BASI|nr:hypothetical protein EX895_002089 [Sporisorium graminicola]TKY88848.1 hypothetical protein EX895_002089 [Sporisorium graminicola]
MPAQLSSFDKGVAADIRMQLDAATDEADLAGLARELYSSPALRAERASIHLVQSDLSRTADQEVSNVALNQLFLLSLTQACRRITGSTGRNGATLMDQLVGKYLRRLYKCIPHRGFSESFLSRLAKEAGVYRHNSDNTVLLQLLDIVHERLSRTGASQASAQERTNTRRRAAHFTSQILLNLMQSFSRVGRSDAVRSCFELLQHHALPVNILQYQLQLIALFRERVSDLAGKDQTDIERESHRIQTDILQIKTMMEANSITLDDTVLATIVNGLSAPLRNPLASASSVAQANGALELVRTIFGQSALQARGDAFGRMPRLVSSLINAEIDAIERNRSSISKAHALASERVQGLIHRLEAQAALSKSPLVGSLRRKPFTEINLACVYLKLRLYAVLGDADRGIEQLQLLLSVEPLAQLGPSGEQRQELILKQRSGVIKLFSAVMQRRQGSAGQDAAFEVLHRAFSSKWFDRVWAGVALPSNLGAGLDIKAYDPDASVLRLWTRWIHAWSADYLAEGTRIHGGNSGSKGSLRSKHRTFTGSYPWQTLKRGLRLLNKVIDQYEAIETLSVGTKLISDDINLDPKPSARIAAFATAFSDRTVLSNMVKVCLRGGRPASNETMATHVERRLTLLIRTLTRVYAPARTWEHVERSMLRRLALIPREVMPTSAVKDAMDQIEQRKHLALLRNPDLVRELDQAATVGRDAPETGSIFVLRRMLQQRASQHSPDSASQPKAAFF